MANIFDKGEALLVFSEKGLIVHAQSGTGDNLLKEDLKAGYVDYIDWTSYRPTIVFDIELEEVDGGMAMFKKYISDLTDETLISALKQEAGLSPDAAYTVINA
jgi:hypothetical protein